MSNTIAAISARLSTVQAQAAFALVLAEVARDIGEENQQLRTKDAARQIELEKLTAQLEAQRNANAEPTVRLQELEEERR